MSLVDDAWRGVKAELGGISGLAALLTSDRPDPIIWGWPPGIVEPPFDGASEFPVITGMVSGLRAVNQAGPFFVPLNLWVWPDLGLNRMRDIDSLLEEHFDPEGSTRTFIVGGVGGRRICVHESTTREWPQVKGEPLRRTRTLRCGF